MMTWYCEMFHTCFWLALTNGVSGYCALVRKSRAAWKQAWLLTSLADVPTHCCWLRMAFMSVRVLRPHKRARSPAVFAHCCSDHVESQDPGVSLQKPAVPLSSGASCGTITGRKFLALKVERLPAAALFSVVAVKLVCVSVKRSTLVSLPGNYMGWWDRQTNSPPPSFVPCILCTVFSLTIHFNSMPFFSFPSGRLLCCSKESQP